MIKKNRLVKKADIQYSKEIKDEVLKRITSDSVEQYINNNLRIIEISADINKFVTNSLEKFVDGEFDTVMNNIAGKHNIERNVIEITKEDSDAVDNTVKTKYFEESLDFVLEQIKEKVMAYNE